MINMVDKKLKELRSADFKSWVTTMWLVKRRMLGKDASYSILRVDINKKLQMKLKRAVTDKIQSTEYKIEPYSFVTADQDNSIYTIDTSDTDFKKIRNEIQNGLDNGKVESFEDLLDSWAYIIELKQGDKVIYGLRKINKLAKAKKVQSVSALLFKDHVLVDIDDDDHVFTIDTHIDFFEYGDTTFIINKKEFESALNFRKGMEDNRDLVLDEFYKIGLFQDVEPIRRVVGANLHLLRKISLVKKNEYYKDKTFIKNLMKINTSEKWNLPFKDSKIILTEDNVGLVLTLLNNSRLKSPINQEVFDAIVKNKVV